jgi:hypothetical protein
MLKFAEENVSSSTNAKPIRSLLIPQKKKLLDLFTPLLSGWAGPRMEPALFYPMSPRTY